MSTVKATNFQHPSASAAGITLGSDGSVVLPSGFTGGIGTNVASTTKTDVFSTTNTSQTDITGLSVSITPTSSTSKILVVVSLGQVDTSGVISAFGDITRDGTPIGIGDASGSRSRMSWNVITAAANRTHTVSWSYLDSPATTSSVTYQARIGGGSGTKYVNRADSDNDASSTARAVATITAIEVAA